MLFRKEPPGPTYNIARFVGSPTNLRTRAAIYEMAPPLRGHRRVAVSSTVAPLSGPETLIFAVEDSGEVRDFLDIGGLRGTLSHPEALFMIRYTAVFPFEGEDYEVYRPRSGVVQSAAIDEAIGAVRAAHAAGIRLALAAETRRPITVRPGGDRSLG